MRSLFVVSLSLIVAFSSFARETITVYRDGYDFFVRSRYSEKQDIVIENWRYANENAYLVDRTLPMKDVKKKGFLLHSNGDEYPATAPLGSYGTLGGNHGLPYAASILTIPNHGFTQKDFGGVITDKKGKVFIIMNIPDKNHLFIVSEGNSSTLKPFFKGHDGKSELFYKGKKLQFTKSQGAHLYPLNRITDNRLLADGKTPVPDKTEVKCNFVDFIFVHDVLNPYSIIQSVRQNPGKPLLANWQNKHKMEYVHTPELRKQRPEYMKLPSLATYFNKFRFEPRGAVINYRKAVYHVPLSYVSSMDLMFGWGAAIAKQKNTWFYIPKLKPLILKDNRKKLNLPDIPCDLSAVYKMPTPMMMRMKVSRSCALNDKDLPDRYIRVTGNEKPVYGIVLGYSLISGCTRKDGGNLERENVYSFRETKKMYPIAYTLRKNKPGKTMETIAYKQYFDPQLEPDATDFYCHYENDSLMVYLDFHKDLKNKSIQLPAEAAGKKITIVEKTPSLALHTNGKIPANAKITLDVTGKYGYLVLKLD